MGWLTGRDDDGVHDLVGEGLALGPGGRERIALQLRVLDDGGNPRRTNEVVMNGHHAAHINASQKKGDRAQVLRRVVDAIGPVTTIADDRRRINLLWTSCALRCS